MLIKLFLSFYKADKKREEKIQSLIEERKCLKEALEIKKGKIVDLTQNLIDIIKKVLNFIDNLIVYFFNTDRGNCWQTNRRLF